MLNLSTVAEICGKDVKTVRAWLSALESSGLVYLLEPYYNNFSCLEKIPDKKVAFGALICPAKERLPLTEKDWILPVHLI